MSDPLAGMYDHVSYFSIGLQTEKKQILHYNFSERVIKQMRKQERKCKICENNNIRLMTCHLFSPEENGNCYDPYLDLRFINSIDNAAVMCRRCHCRFGEILRFILDKSNAQLQKNILKCYFCDDLMERCSTYKNADYICDVMYCKRCCENINHILEYMKSVSGMLKEKI